MGTRSVILPTTLVAGFFQAQHVPSWIMLALKPTYPPGSNKRRWGRFPGPTCYLRGGRVLGSTSQHKFWLFLGKGRLSLRAQRVWGELQSQHPQLSVPCVSEFQVFPSRPWLRITDLRWTPSELGASDKYLYSLLFSQVCSPSAGGTGLSVSEQQALWLSRLPLGLLRAPRLSLPLCST